ncbi:MAG: hypothetical protein R3Y43_01915 [Alphaproteobacteria bacterium]
MKNLLDLQSLFANELFTVGENHKILIIAQDENEYKVTFCNNIQGIVINNVNLETGRTFNAQIAEIKNGIPYFKLYDEDLFLLKPQRGIIKMITPQAIAGYFDNGSAWIYKGKQQKFMEIDSRVIIEQIYQAKNHFEVKSLSPAPELNLSPLKVKEIIREEWTKEEIDDALSKGSAKMNGKVRIGKIYCDLDANPSQKTVNWPGGLVGTVYPFLPDGCKKADVIVTFIDNEQKIISVDLIKAYDENGRWMKSFDSNRDPHVYLTAKNNNEILRAGCYGVGFTYENAQVVDGKIFLPTTNSDADFILNEAEVEVVNNVSVAEDAFYDVKIIRIEALCAEMSAYKFFVEVI